MFTTGMSLDQAVEHFENLAESSATAHQTQDGGAA